jgi:putative spermidine/putrescine transport system permease protein
MRWKGQILAAPVTLWLSLAFAAPLVVVLLLSLHEYADPFGPLFLPPSLAQFQLILGDGFYLRVLGETLLLGVGVTALSAVLGFPLALWLVSVPAKWRALAFMVILIPLLTNVVVRSLGVVLLLAPDGLINGVLGLFGIGPFNGMLYNHFAVAVALAQIFMPFIVLALYDVLQGTSPRVYEAATSLGASPTMTFWTVRFPMALPGLRAGIIVVFLMATTAYVSAKLLGGGRVWTTGMLVFQEAISNLNAPTASALALLMTVASLAFAALCGWIFTRLMPWQSQKPRGRTFSFPAWLVLLLDLIGPVISRVLTLLSIGLLTMPLVLVILQSVNDVPQGTSAAWRGFTLRWYQLVFSQGTYAESFWISVQLAVATMLTALAISLPAAFALTRFRFRGIGALFTFWMLPLSLPGVAIGIGLLRLLQAFYAIPTFLGIMALHVVLVVPFCISLLAASVQQLDRAQEEAAESLGANGFRRFVLITAPALMPGLVAAGIMSFLMSFGEVTVTSFLTNARMTTLPVRIYAEATFVLEATVYAVSGTMMLVTLVALVLMSRVFSVERLHVR